MMNYKAIVFLLMVVFAFSSLSPILAVPSSRSLKSIIDENKISTQGLHDDQFQKKERIDMEIADYSGTGANTHHDPKTPPGSF